MIQDHSQFMAASAYGGNAEERIGRFLPMVRKLAWHFAGSGGPTVDVDDLMQAGLVALTECTRRHQGAGEDGFAAYAKTRVRGAMIDLLRKSSFTPRGVRARQRLVSEARERLASTLGRIPTELELAMEVKLSVSEIRQSLQAPHYSTVPFDEACDDIERSSGHACPTPEEIVATDAEREALTFAIAGLPERQAQVIQLYFVEELNLAEIAAILGISVPRVHQIKAAALGKIREALESEFPHCYD